MKLLFKQKFFSWFDNYDIYDEAGNIVYKVKGELSWGHQLRIYNNRGEAVGLVKERIITLLPKFAMYVGGQQIGEIRKEFTFFRPKFYLTCNDWQVKGDLWEWNYEVVGSSGRIMSAYKKLFNFTDTYVLDIEREEDALYSLMIVLAIDAAKCSRDSRND